MIRAKLSMFVLALAMGVLVFFSAEGIPVTPSAALAATNEGNGNGSPDPNASGLSPAAIPDSQLLSSPAPVAVFNSAIANFRYIYTATTPDLGTLTLSIQDAQSDESLGDTSFALFTASIAQPTPKGSSDKPPPIPLTLKLGMDAATVSMTSPECLSAVWTFTLFANPKTLVGPLLCNAVGVAEPSVTFQEEASVPNGPNSQGAFTP